MHLPWRCLGWYLNSTLCCALHVLDDAPLSPDTQSHVFIGNEYLNGSSGRCGSGLHVVVVAVGIARFAGERVLDQLFGEIGTLFVGVCNGECAFGGIIGVARLGNLNVGPSFVLDCFDGGCV